MVPPVALQYCRAVTADVTGAFLAIFGQRLPPLAGQRALRLRAGTLRLSRYLAGQRERACREERKG